MRLAMVITRDTLFVIILLILRYKNRYLEMNVSAAWKLKRRIEWAQKKKNNNKSLRVLLYILSPRKPGKQIALFLIKLHIYIVLYIGIVVFWFSFHLTGYYMCVTLNGHLSYVPTI